MKAATVAGLFLVTLLASCVPPVAPPRERPPPPSLSEAVYAAAAARGESVFQLDAQRSLIVITAYRGGSLARFGHDHVIAGREVHGFAWLAQASEAQRADLYVPLDSLTVDEPALRAKAGLDTTPSAADIEGTRHNMLVKVLHTERYPYVALRVTSVSQTDSRAELTAELVLHGVTRPLQLPVSIDTAGGELRVIGEFTLKQTEFAITPFSILGGALRVEDQLDLRFELYGRPLASGGAL